MFDERMVDINDLGKYGLKWKYVSIYCIIVYAIQENSFRFNK